MEARKITIVSTKNQKKSVIMSSATTLGELKRDLDNENIDYTGMTFYEGLSKTELKTNESILPHDIERNGVITNELVFMMTNMDKKIASGATRSELYNAVKNLNLTEICKNIYGKNFTQCSTKDLESLVESTVNAKAKVNNPDVAIACLVMTLVSKNIISNKEGNEILSHINVTMYTIETSNAKSSDIKSPYTDEEIDKMFAGV